MLPVCNHGFGGYLIDQRGILHPFLSRFFYLLYCLTHSSHPSALRSRCWSVSYTANHVLSVGSLFATHPPLSPGLIPDALVTKYPAFPGFTPFLFIRFKVLSPYFLSLTSKKSFRFARKHMLLLRIHQLSQVNFFTVHGSVHLTAHAIANRPRCYSN